MQGVQIASGRIGNHLEEQTRASSKLAAQSTVAATEEASKAMLIRQAKPAESFDWIVRPVAVGGGIKWLVVGEQEASIRRSRCGRKQVLLSPLFQPIPEQLLTMQMHRPPFQCNHFLVQDFFLM